MEEAKEKSTWKSPELYILDFKKTATGFVTDPAQEDGYYTATQSGS